MIASTKPGANIVETIIDLLEEYREKRHEAAQRRYSEIVQRFDSPRPGDAELLDQTMVELKIDHHQLEHDVHLIQRYRIYLHDSTKAETQEAREQAKKDAEGIRQGSRILFLSLEDAKDQKQDQPHQ
jgi:hypothetical protein